MTVVLVDPRRPALVPVDAVELLTGDVQYTEEMPVKVPWSLPAARPAYSGEPAPVLLSSDPDHPTVRARLAAGEQVIRAPGPQPGERLVDAVVMMDKLRTAGPWESEQTHDSLRRYLLEETYEVFDAVHSGNADELRDELGDVLLQVLFHARIAEDAPRKPSGRRMARNGRPAVPPLLRLPRPEGREDGPPGIAEIFQASSRRTSLVQERRTRQVRPRVRKRRRTRMPARPLPVIRPS